MNSLQPGLSLVVINIPEFICRGRILIFSLPHSLRFESPNVLVAANLKFTLRILEIYQPVLISNHSQEILAKVTWHS